MMLNPKTVSKNAPVLKLVLAHFLVGIMGVYKANESVADVTCSALLSERV